MHLNYLLLPVVCDSSISSIDSSWLFLIICGLNSLIYLHMGPGERTQVGFSKHAWQIQLHILLLFLSCLLLRYSLGMLKTKSFLSILFALGCGSCFYFVICVHKELIILMYMNIIIFSLYQNLLLVKMS